eukprot:2755809-Pyramimonas_sp.AAC.1
MLVIHGAPDDCPGPPQTLQLELNGSGRHVPEGEDHPGRHAASAAVICRDRRPVIHQPPKH